MPSYEIMATKFCHPPPCPTAGSPQMISNRGTQSKDLGEGDVIVPCPIAIQLFTRSRIIPEERFAVAANLCICVLYRVIVVTIWRIHRLIYIRVEWQNHHIAIANCNLREWVFAAAPCNTEPNKHWLEIERLTEGKEAVGSSWKVTLRLCPAAGSAVPREDVATPREMNYIRSITIVEIVWAVLSL